MINIMDDSSVTCDYQGIIEMQTIRTKVLQFVLEGYQRVYRQALEQAVQRSQLRKG